MRTILIALAALLLGATFAGEARAASAPEHVRTRYTGFFYGLENPSELAALIDRTLETHPDGRTMIDAAKCRRDGSCAAPINYLESFQEKDPHGGWTMENLTEKLRHLRLDCNLAGEYQMDRIIVRGSGLGLTDLNGMHRRFEAEECAWVNPDTGRPVLAGKCTNPVGQRVDLPCVIVNVEISSGEEALIWGRYEHANDECFAYRRVSRLYEPDSPTASWQVVPNGCIGRPCNLVDMDRGLGRQHVAQGEIPLGGAGIYQIRLSPDELLGLCVKYRGSQGIVSSFASGVLWQRDYVRVGNSWQAHVYHASDQVEAAGLHLNDPRGLAFWASSREDEAVMLGLAAIRR